MIGKDDQRHVMKEERDIARANFFLKAEPKKFRQKLSNEERVRRMAIVREQYKLHPEVKK